jgi:hypothetical protein
MQVPVMAGATYTVKDLVLPTVEYLFYWKGEKEYAPLSRSVMVVEVMSSKPEIKPDQSVLLSVKGEGKLIQPSMVQLFTQMEIKVAGVKQK